MDNTTAPAPVQQIVMVEKPRNGLATAALVLGILALIFSFIPFINTISLVLAIVAIGLLIPAFIKALKQPRVGLGRAIAAAVLAVASIFSFTMVNAAAVTVIDSAVTEINESSTANNVDVTLGELEIDEYGYATVEVTLVNTGTETESAWVELSATSTDGSEQYDTTSVIVNDLAPGQTATETATFLTDDVPADAVITVTDVS